MKQIDSIAGKCYIATAPNGGTVTDEAGRTLATVAAGEQKAVWGTDGKLYLSDDDGKLVLATFKYAALALRLLGGGSILPAGYKRLEYLESTGTQYINTGCSVTGASAFSARLAVMGEPALYNTWGLLGCLEAWKVNMFGLVVDAQKLQLRYNAAVYNTFAPEPGRVYSTSYEDGAFRIDGELKATIPVAAEMEVSAPFGLFCYLGPEGTPVNGRFPTRIYQVNLLAKDGKHEFIPSQDETGAPCMFDLVTRTPFYNVGSGDFVTPPTGASTYSLRGRRVLPDLGKLTPTGLRRLYHTPANYEGELYDYAMENGYKPIVEENAPEDGYWVPVWHDRDDCIELEWVETDPPADEELLTEA